MHGSFLPYSTRLQSGFSSFPTLPIKLASSCLLSERRDVIFDSLADWADSWHLGLSNVSHTDHNWICDIIGYATKLRCICSNFHRRNKILVHLTFCLTLDLFIWWTKNWDVTQKFGISTQFLGFDPMFGIGPNFWEKSQFLGFATSWTRYRGKRLPLKYYKRSRWLKTLWGMVQILHETLLGVQNYFWSKYLLTMDRNFAK